MKRHNVFNIDNNPKSFFFEKQIRIIYAGSFGTEVMYAEYLALLVYSHKNSFKKYYFTILLNFIKELQP